MCFWAFSYLPILLDLRINTKILQNTETEDKKGGVDRSSTVIAKDPEGKLLYTTTYTIHLHNTYNSQLSNKIIPLLKNIPNSFHLI